MQVDLSRNYFDLFGLPIHFELDRNVLVKRFRELQAQYHPDKFAAKPDAERRWSMQAASLINEAYQTLGNDLRRAVYLLSLHNISIDDETDTQMDPMFLMEQMDIREALSSVDAAGDPLLALDKIRRQLKSSVVTEKSDFAGACAKQDWSSARSTVRQWQFLDKLGREVKQTEERLDI